MMGLGSTVLSPAAFNIVEGPDGSDLCVNHLSDEELMARCAGGDRRAMDILVSRYHGKLLDFVLRHLGNRDRAADVVQNAFVRAFESAATYRVKAAFKTWLYTIALNLIRDECRRRTVRKESLASEIEYEEYPLARSNGSRSPEEAVLDQITGSMIWKAIGGLPESQQTAVTLRFRHGMTYDEIAAVMGVPSGTVKSWIHYALKTLRQELQPLECEG